MNPVIIDVVKAVISKFVTDKEMFTSVDISNHIKRHGIWVSNSDVAKILHEYDWVELGYQITRIQVKPDLGASLYHPQDTLAGLYTKTDQVAITPSEFNNMVFNDSTVELASVKIEYSFVKTLIGDDAKGFMKKLDRQR